MRYKRRIWIALASLAFLVVVFGVGLGIFGHFLDYQLPKEALRFERLKPPSALAWEDHEGRVFDYDYDFDTGLSIYRPLSEISAQLVDFVVMLEDAKFFGHKGFDVEEIKNSIEQDLVAKKARRGASTITQQLAKNLFLDKKKSILRKFFEIPWTLRLEQDLKKRQILELYFNVIEWGPGIYGAEAAARHYFDRHAAELDLGQAMYLALIVPNPPRFDLFRAPKMQSFLEEKKSWLVERLVNEKKIAPEEKDHYLSASFGLVPPDHPHRRFMPSHDGDYFGNRNRRPKAWTEIKARLQNFASRKGGSIRLSLDKFAQEDFSARKVVPEEGAAERFVLLKEGENIRALRHLDAGQGLAGEETEESAEEEDAPASSSVGNYEREEVSEVDWKSLVL